MTDPIVGIEHLSFGYGPRVAINDLSLTVGAGEIFGFLGPNGSGKTTLFRILSTLVAPPVGTVRLFGLDPATRANDIRPRLGVVFQSPSLDKQLTADENLRHHGHLYGLSGPALEEQITVQLRRMNLLDRRGERVEGFSGGMRRRVELAKGLLNRPDILLLDEPSTGLDPAARIELWDALQTVQSAGVTILLTTHLMDEADKCGRLAILMQGKLIACDTPSQLKSQIGGDVITIRTNTPAEVSAQLRSRLNLITKPVDHSLQIESANGYEMVPKIIAETGSLVEAISVGRPTLEDVFVKATGERFRIETFAEPRSKKRRRSV